MSSRDRNTFNEINITPLTDIFLVLLIIMMVIAPLLDQQGLNLAVPNNVEVQDVKQDNKLISVTVSDDDRYFIDESEVAVTQLDLKHLTELLSNLWTKQEMLELQIFLYQNRRIKVYLDKRLYECRN